MKLEIHHPHAWDVTPAEARAVQERLRSWVVVKALDDSRVRLVGGVDAAYSRDRVHAAVVVLDFPALEPVEQVQVSLPVKFPYIPGLLSFREAPAVIAALEKVEHIPGVLLFDGHGLAHPRRFGIACHLGVLLDIPTIGCAKSILVGSHASLGQEVGSASDLYVDGELVGAAVRTCSNTKPVYVSVGNRIDLDSAVRIVLACGKGHRLPEPCGQAHRLAGALRSSSR